MTALAGIEADLYVGSRPATSFTNEATTDLGTAGGAPAARHWYRVTDQSKRFWDQDAAVVVERDTGGGYAVVDAAEYVVRHAGGVIEFLAQQGVGDAIRVDGSYLPITQLGQAHKWSLDIAQELLTVPVFGDAWQARIPGQLEATVTIERYWVDELMMEEVAAGNPVIVALYTDYSAGIRYEGYARIKNVQPSAELTGTVDEALSLEITGVLSYVPT